MPHAQPDAQAAEPSTLSKGIHAALRWVLPIAALGLLGPLAAAPVRALRDLHGGDAVTLLLNTSPIMGVLAALIVIATATVGAALGARLVAPAMGRMVGGLTVAWAAIFLGDTGNTLTIAGPGVGTILTLVVEATILLVGGAVILLAAEIAARPVAEGGAEEPGRPVSRSPVKILGAMKSRAALAAIVAAAAGGLLGAWLVARDDLRGQAFMAAVLGAIVAGAVGRLVAWFLGKNQGPEGGILPAGLGVLLAGVVAPTTLFVMPGLADVADSVRAASFAGPGVLAPLDWLGGALLGASIGVNWAASTLDKESGVRESGRGTRR